jgi:hypothetical protein
MSPKPKIPTEAQEQAWLATWLDLRFGYYNWIHVPNEGLLSLLPPSKRRNYLLKAEREGVKGGFPDNLIWVTPPHELQMKGVALELKRRKLFSFTERQKRWGLELPSLGWLYIIGYGAEDAVRKLEEIYGK